MTGVLINVVLNSRPIYPKQPEGFDAIEKAIDKYDAAWAANNWQSPYSPYHRVRQTLNRRRARRKRHCNR